jgi:hypothetical protein
MKTLDKHTKIELIQLLTALQAQHHALGLKAAQLIADKACLRDRISELEDQAAHTVSRADYDALETRRKFEAASYAAKLRQAKQADTQARVRVDWAAKAREYCTQFGVSSVSRTDLRRFVENART